MLGDLHGKVECIPNGAVMSELDIECVKDNRRWLNVCKNKSMCAGNKCFEHESVNYT